MVQISCFCIFEANYAAMSKPDLIGYTKDSGFQTGVRKTFDVSVETAWDYLLSPSGIDIWLGPFEYDQLMPDRAFKTKNDLAFKITTFKPYSHVRLSWKPEYWANVSALQVRVINAKGKATVSFHQDKLLDVCQREEMKKHWSSVLDEIGAAMSGSSL